MELDAPMMRSKDLPSFCILDTCGVVVGCGRVEHSFPNVTLENPASLIEIEARCESQLELNARLLAMQEAGTDTIYCVSQDVIVEGWKLLTYVFPGWGLGTTAPKDGRSDATVITPFPRRSSAACIAVVLRPPGPTPIITMPLQIRVLVLAWQKLVVETYLAPSAAAAYSRFASKPSI